MNNLCSWCSTPLTQKSTVVYNNEYICRRCFLNHLIYKEMHDVECRDFGDSDREITAGTGKRKTADKRPYFRASRGRDGSSIQAGDGYSENIEERRGIVGTCDYCNKHIYNWQNYFHDGDKKLHSGYCAINAVKIMYLDSLGWNFQKGSDSND